MVTWTCDLVLIVCVLSLECLVAIERRTRPVVFSYSSADIPNPTPTSNSPQDITDQQQFNSSLDNVGQQSKLSKKKVYTHNDSYAETHSPETPIYYGRRIPKNQQPHSTAAPSSHDYVTVNPNNHHIPTTVAYYDEAPEPTYGNVPRDVHPTDGPALNDPSSIADYYDDRTYNLQPNRLSTSINSNNNHYDYDYSSSPTNPPTTTARYYSDPPVNYRPNDPRPTSMTVPVEENNAKGYKYVVINPDNSYHSTTVTYYDKSSTESYRAPPSSSSLMYNYDSIDYDNSTDDYTSNGEKNYPSIPRIYSPHSTAYYQDYTKDSQPSNNSLPNAFSAEDDAPAVTTPTANSYEIYPSEKPSFPYHSETSQQSENKSPRTPKRRIYSSTTNYYEDSEELVSTTPVAHFESAREKLPPIHDYPPPNREYITKPFKNNIINWKNSQKNSEPQLHVSSVASKISRGDKILQKPKYFAYSSDLAADQAGDEGTRGTDFHVEQTAPQEVESEDYDHQEQDHQQGDDHHDRDYHDGDHNDKKEEKYSKGGGQEHHSSHKASGGDKGDKGYKSVHEYSSRKKGHHDKEDHKGKYVDEKGKRGKKKEEGGHYGEHHKAEKGKKAAKYGESGEHKKGHSTKGEHNIHKKDEYMKKHEFYDEHHEGGDHENFGGFMAAHAHKKGAKKKKGHHKSSSSHHEKGKKGHHLKGEKADHKKGHKDAKGYDGHFAHHKKYGKKGGHKEGKKWGYSKGHPK